MLVAYICMHELTLKYVYHFGISKLLGYDREEFRVRHLTTEWICAKLVALIASRWDTYGMPLGGIPHTQPANWTRTWQIRIQCLFTSNNCDVCFLEICLWYMRTEQWLEHNTSRFETIQHCAADSWKTYLNLTKLDAMAMPSKVWGKIIYHIPKLQRLHRWCLRMDE